MEYSAYVWVWWGEGGRGSGGGEACEGAVTSALIRPSFGLRSELHKRNAVNSCLRPPLAFKNIRDLRFSTNSGVAQIYKSFQVMFYGCAVGCEDSQAYCTTLLRTKIMSHALWKLWDLVS